MGRARFFDGAVAIPPEYLHDLAKLLGSLDYTTGTETEASRKPAATQKEETP